MDRAARLCVRLHPTAAGERVAGVPEPAGVVVSLGNIAAFLLVAVLAGAALWRGRFPFWARVMLVLLGLLGMVITLLDGMGRL